MTPKIGVLVDGQAEYHSLPSLLRKIPDIHPIVGDPLYCDIQPYSTNFAQQALRVVTRAQILIAKGATSLVILVDKEERQGCDGLLAANLSHHVSGKLAERGQEHVGVYTVTKVRKFENWLISDVNALKSLKNMFRDVGRFDREIGRNRVDQIDALALLNKHSVTGEFRKVEGAIAICKEMDPLRAAKNSRSFRRFLRVTGHPKYSSQSRKPI